MNLLISSLSICLSCGITALALAQTAPQTPTRTPQANATPPGASVAKLEAPSFPNSITVDGRQLVLNGTSTDGAMTIQTTQVALYLPSRQSTVESILSMPGAKRIAMNVTRDMVSREVSELFMDRMRQNVTKEMRNANFAEQLQFGSLFTESRPKLARGDVVHIDYIPSSKSTTVTLNGSRLGEPIVSEAFYNMLLHTWLGPKVRKSTREGVLGNAALN